ncbi:MAG: endolytic transglycosylase MltG [Bdellovibrionota bacterium]
MTNKPTQKQNKKITVATVGVLSLVIAAAVVVLFFGYQLLRAPVSFDTAEIVFDVKPGATVTVISNELQAKGLIRNSKSFQIYAKALGLASKFKVGEYSLNRAMTPIEIMSVIVSGKSIARSITIAEGFNVFDIAKIFEEKNISTQEDFFKLVYDKEFIKSLLNENLHSLEGYLYPETYKITKFESTKSILTQMVGRFTSVWQEIEPLAKNLGWTRNQIVTFASIVEKETGAGFERPLVSSVFHNRLVQKMRLQTDPTVLYGMALKLKKMPINITKNDLLTATPHNTYTNYELPPTPISNPGKEALLATLQPAQTKYLFFVSQNNGTHVFSENIQQHNRAVQQFQMNSSARKNKSWRDLNKPANKSEK